MPITRFIVIGIYLCFILIEKSNESPGKLYQPKNKVEVFVNKVGPYMNPDETYHYYSLALCPPATYRYKPMNLGERLSGDRLAYSEFKINFKEPVTSQKLCNLNLKPDAVNRLISAIEEDYYFEFFADGLPLRAYVGKLTETALVPHTHKIHLYTDFVFRFSFNGFQITGASIIPQRAIELTENQALANVPFHYSVEWHESQDKTRMETKHIGSELYNVHWVSIVNSTALICLLIGLIGIIMMRVLKNDFSIYNSNPSELQESIEFDDNDVGWKMIQGDVFRFPPAKNCLCSFLGVGSQFVVLTGGVLVLTSVHIFSGHQHGALYSVCVGFYALTCVLAGYVSASTYSMLNGQRWVANVLLTCFAFPGPMFIGWSVANTFHWWYGSTQSLSFGTILFIFAIYFFIAIPLTLVGGILGKNTSAKFDAPCRTKNIPREIPPLPWYARRYCQLFTGGFITFSSIAVEMHYIFETMWGRDKYFLFGVLTLTYLILLFVSASIGLTLTYFLISSEDYRWWWQAFFNSGSCSLFVFSYAVYFYVTKSHMYGLLQTVDYFVYTSLACYVIFLGLGTVSFFTSLRFIRYIYVNLKMD